MDNRMGKVEEQLKSLSSLPNAMSTLANQMKNLEFQLGQVASSSQVREKGKLPSTTEVNPREYCNAITLRSGTNYEGTSMPQEERGGEEEQDSKEEELIKEDEKDAKEEEVEKEKKEDPKKEVWVPKWRKAREARKLKEDET
ncbi:hypothetical protein ACS0TY_021811 [Phlomoides rotata]